MAGLFFVVISEEQGTAAWARPGHGTARWGRGSGGTWLGHGSKAGRGGVGRGGAHRSVRRVTHLQTNRLRCRYRIGMVDGWRGPRHSYGAEQAKHKDTHIHRRGVGGMGGNLLCITPHPLRGQVCGGLYMGNVLARPCHAATRDSRRAQAESITQNASPSPSHSYEDCRAVDVAQAGRSFHRNRYIL